jgi:ADP-glucose pyrophosphorylase
MSLDKISFNLLYTPQLSTAGSGQSSTPLVFSIGDGKDQISLELLAKIIEYVKSGNKITGSFKDLLAASVSDNMSKTERDLLKALNNKDILALMNKNPDELNKDEIKLLSQFSDTEKSLVKVVTTDIEGLANAKVLVPDEKNSGDYTILMGMPTEEYLRDLKLLEELYSKNMELIKYHRKMAKISGNLPLDEMVQDVAGTSIRLSNLHVTDINRLNDIKIHSTAFS